MTDKELRKKIEETKTFNYNVYFGVCGGDNAISFEEAVDEIASLFKQYAKSVVPRRKRIDKRYSTDERRYPHGFNQCRRQMLENIK